MTELVAIFGPTAVGKTEVVVELAHLLRERGENPAAVSADAFQVYEGLDTLTAKPAPDELARLEHRLISFVPLEHSFSVAEFAEHAHREIDAALTGGRRPIVVGGTGLYFRAALTELELKPPPEEGLREELERELDDLGVETVLARLPPDTASTVHPSDRRRIVRALELERMGERPYRTSDQLWSKELRRPARLIGLLMDRDVLAERISARVDRMLEGGAVEEVARALERGASATARKAIGFAEIAAYLDGAATLEQAADRIKRRHRQYAKRQITWMRKLAGVETVDRTGRSPAETAADLAACIDARGTAASKS